MFPRSLRSLRGAPKLVFANYLAEKELNAKCEKEDAMNYQLKVHINGGQREFTGLHVTRA